MQLITPNKILLVDDDPISLHVLNEYLSAEGYVVVAAADGRAAWELLQTNPTEFSAVITDRVLPHLHGIDILKNMLADPILKNIPVIMITGVAEHEERIEAIKAGIFDFLYKPIEKDLLLAVVRKAIHRKTLSS